jgi:hypothetical protein
MINYYLAQTPPQIPSSFGECDHLILDGTFIHRPRSLIALMDAQTHKLVAGQYDVSESSVPQLRAFFKELIEYGLYLVSFTVDGNPHV